MDSGLLIDAIVRQTTVLIAQLATAGGGRTQLAHTANQVFVDLVAALKEQGLGNKVIADMFGMALRTYQTKLQRISESRTERGRSLWEALFGYVQEKGAKGSVSRSDLLQHFRHDDALVVSGVLRDLVDSGLLYRTGRGDLVRFGLADTSFEAGTGSVEEQAESFVWVCVHRLAPADAAQISEALSMDPQLVARALSRLQADGRVRPTSGNPAQFECDSCVLPLGSEAGWEGALFDHFQAVVTAICAKLASGRRSAARADLIGGSTFSFNVWPGHPDYEEVTGFLRAFREQHSALRKKVASYNETNQPPAGEVPRVIVYAGQTVIGFDEEPEASE